MSHDHDEAQLPGACRDCDVEHYIPKNLRATLRDGTTIPVTATYGGLTAVGLHEWLVEVPETQMRVEGFDADSGLQDGHALSFVGQAWAQEQERRATQAALEDDGPDSGPGTRSDD